jgi:hypothetical protein
MDQVGQGAAAQVDPSHAQALMLPVERKVETELIDEKPG